MYFVQIADTGFLRPNCIELCLENLNCLTIHDKKSPWKLNQKSDRRKLPG